MPSLDVFHSDAFSLFSLTDAVNKIKFVPGRIGQMGLFEESGVTTTTVGIEEKSGILSLVSPSPRGGPGQTIDKSLRTMRPLAVPHFEIVDAVMADEVQNVRAWGSETDVESVMAKVAERVATASQSLAATQEYSRIGAIKGTITYADSSTLSLFTTFGVTQETEIDFDLDNASPTAGALRTKCAGVIRQIAGILEGTPFSGVRAFCGDTFFDNLIAHVEVRNTYLQTQQANELRSAYIAPGGMAYGAFEFGGITWENYRGSVGGTSFVNTDKCHIFPIGVPGLFRTYYAPADYTETVNTRGQRLYSKQYDMQNGKGVHLETQMNALDICTRPKVLILGKRT